MTHSLNNSHLIQSSLHFATNDKTTDIETILSFVIGYTKKKVISRGQRLAKTAGLKKEDLKSAAKSLFRINTGSGEYLKIENRLRHEDLIEASDTLCSVADELLRNVAGAGTSSDQ